MKNKGLLFSAVLATVLFVGNVKAISFSATVGTIKVINKTEADIWVTFNSGLSSSCPGGCNYTRIAARDYKSPLASVTGSYLNVYSYADNVANSPLKDKKIKTDAVEVSIQNGKITLTEVGK